MSLRGGINKEINTFRESVRSMALQGMLDKEGNVLGTKKLRGYVCGVHLGDEEDESLRWTVDVQELDFTDNETPNLEPLGVHYGVLLNGLTKPCCGFRIVPLMYSDVIIAKDPKSKDEYVIAYTDAQEIMVESHEKVTIGVKEHEEFSDDSEGLEKDYYELEEKENSSETNYEKDKIIDVVKSGDSATTIKQTAEGLQINVNDKATINITEDKYSISVNGQGTIDVSDDGMVKINGETYSAVLYEKLSQFLTKFIQLVSTATAAGSPLSTAANIAALTSELETFKSQTVKIGK